MKKRTLIENRVNCVCRKCNKPYSFDKTKGYSFGELCRSCASRGKKNANT